MCARIFYGSYNAVAMHRIVMRKSSGDKHIHSRAWAGSGSRRCFMEMMGSALQGAAWLQCCPSPARGCWQRNLPQQGQWERHLSSCGHWGLCKGQSKVPLASRGHHSLGTNATAELDHTVKAKSFSCCHTAKFVLQRWNLTSLGARLWCDQRALVWRDRHSQCRMSFWETELYCTLGAFNNSKISKVRDRNLYSALPLYNFPLFPNRDHLDTATSNDGEGHPLFPKYHLPKVWALLPSQGCHCDGKISFPHKLLHRTVTYIPNLSKVFGPCKGKEKPKVYTAEDTSINFLFIIWSPTAVEMRLISMFSQQARVIPISLHIIFWLLTWLNNFSNCLWEVASTWHPQNLSLLRARESLCAKTSTKLNCPAGKASFTQNLGILEGFGALAAITLLLMASVPL